METHSITWDGLLLAIGGLLGFVIREILSSFYLGPAHRLRQLIGKIAFSLDYYANRLRDDSPEGREARDIFRRQACELRELVHAVPSYWFFRIVVGLLPARVKIEEASKELIGLSNTSTTVNESDRPSERSSKIQRLLGIKAL
jgi:hypothetical protein